MLVPGSSAQETNLVLENQQCRSSGSAAQQKYSQAPHKIVQSSVLSSAGGHRVHEVSEGKRKKKSRVFLQGIPRQFKGWSLSVHLVSRENDFLGMDGTLFLPELYILRCTRHPTVFLRWKQSLFFLFRKWKAYRGCTSSLHRANTTTLQSQEDGRKVRKVTEAKPELGGSHLSKKLSQIPPNIVNLYPPICIKKVVWVLDENFGLYHLQEKPRAHSWLAEHYWRASYLFS